MTPQIAVEFHPEAIEEARAARRWYAERSRLAAEAFQAELDRAVLWIGDAPSRWPHHSSSTRRFVMHRYPFSVVYFELERSVLVLAVAHAKRRPGYWQDRLPPPLPRGRSV
jgi:toxin ParE1/3/4